MKNPPGQKCNKNNGSNHKVALGWVKGISRDDIRYKG